MCLPSFNRKHVCMCASWILSIQDKVFVRNDTRDVQKLNINSPTKVLMVNFNAINVRLEDTFYEEIKVKITDKDSYG